MTDAAQGRTAPERHQAYGDPAPSGWVGWIFFAGIMMVMLGSFEAIVGLVAIFNDDYYLVASSGLVVSVDYTGWGWLHLILGVVAFCAGLGVMAGQTWARVVGILLATVSAVVNLAFIAAYPVWAVLVIAIDVLVIYALAVHGREAKAALNG
jgi:hypothetical protein